MTTTTTINFFDQPVTKLEDTPEPQTPILLPDVPPPMPSPAQPVDPKDPEGFLRRCSGYNKKKGVRCSQAIGRNSHHTKNSQPTYLPTCYAHKDQQSYAGWCQFMQKSGERCGRLFRWTPPYFELCAEHQGHPDTPCFFLRLPLELRHLVFRHLLPSKPIGSSTSLLHIDEDEEGPGWHNWTGPQSPRGARRLPPPTNYWVSGRTLRRPTNSSPLTQSTSESVFPTPLLDLLLINRQIFDEVKDLLYSTVPFTIDVRKDGTFMCGRRLLEPRRADGSLHFVVSDVDRVKERFLSTFDWRAVKNYNIDVLVENYSDGRGHGWLEHPWDEEVELYDIRDYLGVVVAGILSKSRNLCKLNLRLCLSKFTWDEDELLANIKTIVGPFERLRNVRQPRLVGVYEGTPHTNIMISLPLPLPHRGTSLSDPSPVRPATPLCSIPQLPHSIPLYTNSAFDKYRQDWQRWLSSPSSTSIVRKPPIRCMFTEFKEFYTKLSAVVPEVMARSGRHAFLHRARVAREQEDVEGFRQLRNELIEYWYAHLEEQERKKDDMNRRLSKMLDADIYPATIDEAEEKRNRRVSVQSGSSGVQSPVILDVDKMAAEGIPMQGSQINEQRRLRAMYAMRAAQIQAQQANNARLQQRPGCSMQVLMPSNPQAPQSLQNSQNMALNPQPPNVTVLQHLTPQSQQAILLQQLQQQEQQPRVEGQQLHRHLMTQQRDLQRSAFASTVPHPQTIALPMMQMQQLQEQTPTLQDYTLPEQPHENETPDSSPVPNPWDTSNASTSSSSSGPSTNPSPISNDEYNALVATRAAIGAALREKREYIGIDGDDNSAKRQRLDCEPGWDGVQVVGAVEFNENGDEIMVVDDDVDVFKGWREPEYAGKWKGKGKERATEPEIVWLD